MYLGGYALVGVIFVVTIAAVVLMGSTGVPEWMSTLATALGSGIIGGLFGYAKQS